MLTARCASTPLVSRIFGSYTTGHWRRGCRIVLEHRGLHHSALSGPANTRLPSSSPSSLLNNAGVVVKALRGSVRVREDVADSIAIATRQQKRRRRRQLEAKVGGVSPPASDGQRDLVQSVTLSSPVPATPVAVAASTPSLPAASAPPAPSSPSSSAPAPDLSVKSLDPDFSYATDEDSTRASLLAFAELEGRLRTKRNLSSSAATPPLPQPAPPSPPPSLPPAAAADSDATVTAVGLDAFAALELQLAKKRLDAKRGYLNDPLASTRAASAIQSRERGEAVLQPPRLPEANECCGMSCPNCVWIVYAEQLAEYEEQKQRQRQDQT